MQKLFMRFMFQTLSYFWTYETQEDSNICVRALLSVCSSWQLKKFTDNSELYETLSCHDIWEEEEDEECMHWDLFVLIQ